MKQTKRRILAWLMTVVLVLSVVTVLTPAKEAEAAAATAVSTHGKLAVKGTQLVDKNGQPFQIHGVSTHGLQWFGQYNNKAAYQTLRDDWGANAIRLAMYVDEGGYYSDRNGMKKKVTDGVQYATELGMYAIIDWHLLNVNPKNYTSEARSFFKEMAQKYKNYDNVIYEICNEPSNCPWSDIKSYATEVIQTIRAYDKDAIIIVGTPTWSQLGNQGHTYEPADDPIRGYSNLMYAFHFYASESSHNQWLTAKIGTAIDKGLPVFVSEFGLSEASGNGNVDLNKAAEWMKRCDDRNVSYCVWSLCNKNESSALIKSSCGKTSGWTVDDLTKAGQFIRNHYRSRMENTAENNPEIKNLAPNITVSYKTHVQTFGWENEVSNGKMAGTVGSAKRLEGITIRVSGDSNLGIRYKTHVQSFGWEKEWKKDGQMSGTSGKAKRLEAIRIELTGTISSYYDVYYRVHAQSYGWMGWAKNGETAGTAGLGKRLEAIQICLVEKGSDAPNALPAASNAKAYQGTPEPVDNSIIYVYSWNTELGDRLQYFKDKYPQYADKVKYENLGLGGTSDEYKKEIEAAYQKGGQKVPSIVAMDEGVTKYFMSSDMFVNMDSIGITQKDYSNAFQYTIDHATVNGKLKGLCWQATPGCFVYRTDIAQKVLGTSDPAKVQTYVKDWDAFMQTAEKMKQAGYKMVSGPKEIQNAALADRKSAWVNDGTVTIDPAVDKYLELAMQLIDNGYTNKNDPWTDGWVSDFTGDVFGYFGCPWFVYWSINDEESGSATAGKRNICAGPSAYNWGGTYLSVTDKCPNKELAALVLKTLCCDTDVMYKIQDETLDFVNNKAAVQKMIANGKGATPILGGANPLQTWYNVAVKVDGSKATQYDSVFEGYLYTLIDGYENGYNESKDNMKSMLKAMIKDGYPNLTVK